MNVEPVDAALVPRFAGVPSFMRLPILTDPSLVDVALVGVPFDGGTTNRPGARHGPREIRSQSSLMRRINANGVCPYDRLCVADLGDAPVNPIDLHDSLAKIENFFKSIRAAGAIPITAGGDHLITLPILRALATTPAGLIHFDSHSYANDKYFGENPYTHGTPFRRAVKEGLLHPRLCVQIGLLFTSAGTGHGFSWFTDSFLATVAFAGYSFVGFEAAGAIAQEVKEARRVLPAAMILSLAACGVLVSFACLGITLAIPSPPTS